MRKLVGLYAGSNMLIEHPDYFDMLKEEIGLTHILGGGTYKLLDETWAKNPMPPGGEQFAPSCGGDDDSALRQAIDIAHNKGLQVWIGGGGWHGGGERYPELCMRDMHDRPISEVPRLRYAREQPAMAYCPSNQAVNEWLRSIFSEVAATYEVDGFDLTHCRYTAPSFLHNLFGCGCPRCASLAGERGYDFEKMRSSILTFWERIQHLDARAVREAGKRGLGVLDFPQWLGIDSGIAEWFEFRAGVIASNLKCFKESVYEAAGRDIVFGCDTFPATFSVLVGHSYRDFMEWSDYTSTLLPHVEYFIHTTFAPYADLLSQWTEGLEEADALRFVYRLFGYDHLDMPQSLEEFGYESLGMPDCEAKCKALYDIVELELWRARLYNTGEIPSYPVIKGAVWAPEIVKGLVDAAERIGHEGIIFQGTSSLVDYPGI
ncbi:MAG: hypothetical protein HY709_07380 [Candidatus Latescibacteria bacterium]|nr:hypothetical protein [Candidatus Latescibacterota bacterium]